MDEIANGDDYTHDMPVPDDWVIGERYTLEDWDCCLHVFLTEPLVLLSVEDNGWPHWKLTFSGGLVIVGDPSLIRVP